MNTLKIASLISATIFSCFVAAAPASWYKWQSKLNEKIVCTQTSPGEGWYRYSGPYKDGRCEQLGIEKHSQVLKTESLSLSNNQQPQADSEPKCRTVTRCTKSEKCNPGTSSDDADRGACTVEARSCETTTTCD